MSTTSASRISVVPRGTGHTVQVLTDLVCTKVAAEQTGGAFTVFEVTVPPGGGPPLHRHRQAEFFCLLEGELVVLGDGAELPIRPGDFVHVPGSAPHGYRNTGSGMVRMIAIAQPSGLEEFFDDIGVPSDRATEPAPLTGPPDIEHLMAVTARHAIEML